MAGAHDKVKDLEAAIEELEENGLVSPTRIKDEVEKEEAEC